MADLKQLAILKRGADAWNAWSEQNLDVEPELSRVDLRGADLGRSNLFMANLSEANLSMASLSQANLREANLRRANLDRANLREADLGGADLSEADLSGANLIKANLCGTQADRTDFSNAYFDETILADVDLSTAIGLESCNHSGPSTIDFRTLARSRNLPLAFLRGCGLPDTLIDYLPALLNQPIQFYSCFISYSTKDQDFAERLHADLQNKGVRCWFAPHNVQGGRKLHEQIDEAIRLYDRLLLILSEHSMSSPWVKTEIANARQKERIQGRQVLFPIGLVDFDAIRRWKLFDAEIGDDSAREIREYFIPDFSNWKEHDSYQQGLGKLLKDLQSEGKLSPP